MGFLPKPILLRYLAFSEPTPTPLPPAPTPTPAPTGVSWSVTDQAGGQATFTIKFGQPFPADVFLFVSKNSLAGNIFASGLGSYVVDSTGRHVYSVNVGGFVSGDTIKYRFYSSLNGVQTYYPGPTEATFATTTY